MDGRPLILINLHGRSARALIDTGAVISVVAQDAAGIIDTSTKTTLQDFSGHIRPTEGLTDLTLLNRKVRAMVVRSLGCNLDVILGMDILRLLEAKIIANKSYVELLGYRFPYENCDTLIGSLNPFDLAALDVVTELNIFQTPDKLRLAKDVKPLIIETTGNPIAQKPYRAAINKRLTIENEINSMLKADIIEPSTSAWAAPITLVPKKDGSTRFCVDYRALNAVTKKDKYPLPNIQDIFDSLAGSSIYSTLDLKSGYWQMPIDEHSRDKTAFICHVGQFQFKRVPFGLSNAPSYFQRQMNKILSPLLGKCAMVYLDDIVIFSRTPDEHDKHLQMVFELLRKHDLTVKRSKCEFYKSEIDLLGYRVSGAGISPQDEKIKAIRDLPPPKTVKGVRSFLGLANYYRQCVPAYAEIAEPLINLTRKGVKFDWTDACQRNFVQLKNALTADTVMAHPDPLKPYSLFTDACDTAIGAILTQIDSKGRHRVIQYISHSLPDVQRRWATIEKEAYAVIYALQKLRPYLLGADFIVYTDHKPLKSLFAKSMNNTKIQRWAILLAEYGAHIEYIKGKNNVKADALSRLEGSLELPPAPVAPVTTRARKRNIEINLSREDRDLIDLDMDPEEF